MTTTPDLPLTPTPPAVPPRLQLALALLSIALAAWALLQSLHLGDHFIYDESQAAAQVQLFLHHRFQLVVWPGKKYPAAATLPGFPTVLTLLAALTGQSSPDALRLFCFAFSLLYAALLYLTARALIPTQHALLRAAQTFVLPVILPFNSLLYTDVFSLLVITAALHATLRRRHVIAGLLMLLALFVRQTNVIVLALLLALAFQRSPTTLTRPFLRRFWPYLLGFAAFAAFLLVNGRVALDDPKRQGAALTPGNLLFSLVIGALMLWPVLVAHPRSALRWTTSHRPAAAALLLLAAAASFTYTPHHSWNHVANFLHNHLWPLFLASPWQRALLTLLTAAIVFALISRPPPRPWNYLLPAFWLLSLAPIPLIEPRYQFPVFVLYQLTRQPESPRTELLLWLYLASGSIALTYVMTTTTYVI